MTTVISDAEARQNLAANLMHILHERHLTQTQLARASRRPIMSINNVCRGTRLPSVTLVAAIAEALGYATDDLIGPPAIIQARERLKGPRNAALAGV